MAISFPGSPSTGQKFTHGNKSWTWNGNSWIGTTTAGSDAATLGGISSSSFLRSDASDSTTSNLQIQGTLRVGPNLTPDRDGFLFIPGGALSTIQANNENVNFDNNQGNIHIRTMNNSSVTPAERISILSTGNVGIGTNNPSVKFEVDGTASIKQGGYLYFGISTTENSWKNRITGFNTSTLHINSQGIQIDNSGYASPAVVWLKANASELSHKGNTIWHAGNDGSGSGLDADTLDGLHASDIGGGGASDHPQGTILTDDNGSITGSVASTNDAGSLTGSVTSTDNFENVILTAFLNDGDISQTSNGVNATKTLAIHDGVTGGGVEMLRNDLANLSTSMVNQSIQLMNIATQSPYDLLIAGSIPSRITLTETLVGHDMFTLEDSGNRIRCTKDVPNNINIKLEVKLRTNANYRFEVWKNEARQSALDHYTQINVHNTMTSYTAVSFNDILEFRCYSYDGSVNTINILDGGFISLQLIGS